MIRLSAALVLNFSPLSADVGTLPKQAGSAAMYRIVVANQPEPS